MASTRDAEKALFFVGILAAGRPELAVAGRALERLFGFPSRGSRVWPFLNTDYYRDELGPEPVRAFLAFPGLFATDELAARKLATNDLEGELAREVGGPLPRPVNLDPGYLTLAKLVLASAKNYAHRIHIGRRIYAEVTLQYRGGAWRALPWTFPDYASGTYDRFFTELRAGLTVG